MKISANIVYIILYFVMLFVHFGIWEMLNVGHGVVFTRYYMFLTLLFVMVITVLTIIRRMYPQYIGFGFLGLVMVKMMALFIAMNQLELSTVPNYKMHFAAPYLVSLLLETLYAVKLIQIEDKTAAEKDEKNH
ncbi:hypothetical protein CO230_05510 [Chryseobacterium sp. 6424]|uniref:hypothetical protein n=1 Tax=Chryseobacterium sp. 6424 TaxID=2039166 RepID=UPI000EFB357F|nr:hypothetical protein [Chryseobacterium sp. 6424]AYO57625.1 hypothetical protein CO230_05510 [Chryseobacterium sp. 6424]